ncbi:hypothetical protein AAFF_G00102480 [Aldrovandia affinis]|uniref:Uncharacterized protein n=1 Tax=Aldrovandia affinis TaxID=143900 RepID=A0AAD7WB61_9TELE|nr:hypothetical protein AAFF_G00102480 [Aldrovandia affinis]
MVQGNMSPFEKDFSRIRHRAQEMKILSGDTSDNTPTKEQLDNLPSAENDTDDLHQNFTMEPYWVKEMRELKEKFSQLELMQVQMEHSIKNTPPPRPSNTEEEGSLSALWAVVKRLQDNEEASKQEMRQISSQITELKNLSARIPAISWSC